MKKNKKIGLFIAIIFIIGGLLVYNFCFKNKGNYSIKVLDTIKGYSYSLNDNDSSLKKDLFYELKKQLESNSVDNDVYAKLIAQLFVVDVFSLDMKVSKYDIGGLEYVLPQKKEEFKILMGNTIYDSLENNFDGKRKQDLPLVTSINVIDVKETNFKFDNNEFMSYDICLEWTYFEDLGYDNTANIIVSNIDNIMYVMEYANK